MISQLQLPSFNRSTPSNGQHEPGDIFVGSRSFLCQVHRSEPHDSRLRSGLVIRSGLWHLLNPLW